MLEFGLKGKDKLQLEGNKTYYTGWGRGADYCHLYVYDLEDNLLTDEILKPFENFNITTEGTVDFDAGRHLRELGYEDGTYKVQYIFLRKTAGDVKKQVLLNDEGFVHVGKTTTRKVNGVTKFFTDKGSKGETTQKELTLKPLKYVIKEISPNRQELKVDLQDIQNIPYKKNFKSINKDMVYTPKQNTPQAGKIRFDLTDPNVLIFTPGIDERGFTDSMVGGELVIKGMYNYTQVTLPEPPPNGWPPDPPPPPPPPPDEFDERELLEFKKRLIRKKPKPIVEEIEETPAPDNDYDEIRGWDDYAGVCFVGDTKVKLSNNRTISIKLMKPGMKVKTQQGYAKVLKVTKENLPYGDKFVKFGKLITTNNHPIFHKGSWYFASELGKEFFGEPTDVWNLQLDKHHTIYADNVVSATLGKWKSDEMKSWKERFFESRNRFKMKQSARSERLAEERAARGAIDPYRATRQKQARVARIDFPTSSPRLANSEDEMDFGLSTTGMSPEFYEQVNRKTPVPVKSHATNEFIVNKPIKPFTKKVAKKIIIKPDEIKEIEDIVIKEEEVKPTPRPIPPKPIYTDIPIDYVAKIVEVLDYNKVRVDVTYEQGATEAEHSGEDLSTKIFDEFYVNYRKNKIQRLNNYMISDAGYHLMINIIDAPKYTADSDDVRQVTDRQSRYIKLYKPLPDGLEKGDLVCFVEEKMEPYVDTVKLIPFVDDEEEYLFLRVPNLNSTTNPIDFTGTNFRNRNDLIGTDDSTKESITNSVFSSSLLPVQLNIDYQKRTNKIDTDTTDYGFGNFVQFSSAELRLKNFKKKIELVEYYTSSSLVLTNVTGSTRTRQLLDTKKRQVINSFDPYENYLYTYSSSYESSSIGEFYDSAWPKDNSSSPYTLTHTSSSSTWYNTWKGYAKDYDRNNMDRLVNNLPEHVRGDSENQVFLEFMDMVGQQFDETWSYLRHFTDINERVNKISEGISKDIVKEVAKSMGFEINSGNDLVILPTYFLGKDIEGGALNESPSETITEEIWKRILANLPFFMKTKGTARAIKGLLNCYGIPSSLLRIREYGGPDPEGSNRVSYEVKRKFTYALDFKSSEYLKLPWKDDSTTSIKPQTIEFRFRSPESKNQVIVESEDKWAIELTDNGETDNKGRLQFSISGSSGTAFITSSELPFYNDEMWSVMLTRRSASGADLTTDTATQNITYELTTRQYDASRETIVYSNSSSISTNTSDINTAFVTDTDFYIGGANNNFHNTRFSGSLMEFRLWSEPLSQSVFENHIRTPKAYNGNTTGSSYDNLLFRLTMGDNVDLNAQPNANDDKSAQGLYHNSGSAVGFSGNSYRSLVDLEQVRVPNIGPTRRSATKIRLENNTLSGNLSHNIRNEQSSQDFAPIDSNRLGVYFSPTDVVNEDIIYSLADLNIDQDIGDPRDQYQYSYRGLEETQRNYFRKYTKTNNFWDYMRLINFYDRSLWIQLKKLLPARANSNVGLLIEPNILERNKEVIGKLPEFEDLYYENAGHFGEGIKIAPRESGSDYIFSFTGDFPTYGRAPVTTPTDGVINVHNNESGSLGTLGLPTLVRLDEIDPTTEYGTTYATASITFGGINSDFTDLVQVFVSGSRISEHNEQKMAFYTSSLSVSTANGFGNFPKYKSNGNYQYSSSFYPSEYQSMAYDTTLFRSFYKGNLLTKNNTIDGGEPVEVTITSPTRLVTRESGESKLKVE